MKTRHLGFLGIGAWVLFWSSSIVLGALRSSYSHVANTLSELGAAGTPYAAFWNVFGFIVPGIMLAIVGLTIGRVVIPQPSMRRVLVSLLLALAGLAVAGQGLFPAEMIDGVADVGSTATRAHFISSLLSGAAWGAGVLLLVGPMKRNPHWRGFHVVGIALLLLTLAASLGLRAAVPDGLAQRIGNSFFCMWFVVMSVQLIRIDKGNGATSV